MKFMGPLLHIASHDNGQRLDTVLARTYPKYSRSFFQKFLKRGGVKLSGTAREPSYRVRAGETFQVADLASFAEPVSASFDYIASDTVPEIIFEDSALLVIDKPAGLVVHPAPGHRTGTLLDWLRAHLGPKVLKVFTDPERLGLIHRLDKDTSGILVIAKTIPAQIAVARQFHDRLVQKTYVSFVEGTPSAKKGVIDAPVGRSRKTPTRMAVASDGKASETAFEVKESFGEVSLVSLQPKTGRTHQIRVHLSAIGHPIIGDRTYGAKSIWHESYGIKRPLLHAERLKIHHPDTGKMLDVEAPWPEDFKAAHRRFQSAIRTVVLMVALLFGISTARADDHPAHKASSSGSSSSSHSSLSSDVRKLKRDVDELQDQVAALNTTMQKMDFSDRVRDLEHAVTDLNAKSVSGSGSGEEIKTQIMDLSRKIKNQQQLLDQMRDQVDRLNQQVIKQQAAAPAPPAPQPPVTDKGNRP
jgi:23S rRNA pseudouridine1911/1915/1917 synthase